METKSSTRLSKQQSLAAVSFHTFISRWLAKNCHQTMDSQVWQAWCRAIEFNNQTQKLLFFSFHLVYVLCFKSICHLFIKTLIVVCRREKINSNLDYLKIVWFNFIYSLIFASSQDFFSFFFVNVFSSSFFFFYHFLTNFTINKKINIVLQKCNDKKIKYWNDIFVAVLFHFFFLNFFNIHINKYRKIKTKRYRDLKESIHH